MNIYNVLTYSGFHRIEASYFTNDDGCLTFVVKDGATYTQVASFRAWDSVVKVANG